MINDSPSTKFWERYNVFYIQSYTQLVLVITPSNIDV